MLYFQPWKVLTILIVCVLGVILSLPNLFNAQTIERLPSWIPHKQVSLGLDLRGGSHLLLQVDMNQVLRERLNAAVDSARTELRNARIGYTGLAVQGNQVTFTARDLDRLADVRGIVKKIDPELDAKVDPDGKVTLSFNESALAARQRSILDQSIEIVRRRIDETGVREPIIQREGQDRILVQLPGIDNPEHVKVLLGKTAKMTFQLVDTNASVEEAKRVLPPGDEILPSAEDSRHPGATGPAYVVQRRVMVSGDALTDAQATFQDGQPVVSFKFDANGGRRFGEATKANVGKPFAIVLDGKVISAPVIREPITGGAGIISGNFTTQSAGDLALLLRAGALPAPLTVLEERTVGPDLGADSIHAGTLASFVGVGLVIVFMLLFYGLFGLFANVALFFNLCLLLGSLSLLGATLTLPGIAGIALTMGMAVDANVLIYERIREEVRGGRTMLSALEAGFSRAFGTILDSHVTTFVAGVLMFALGSGPVKGFAVTLCLGVAWSLFSAILVTRLQIVSWVRRWRPKAIPI
jgi:preprotein translocase subunit SecD